MALTPNFSTSQVIGSPSEIVFTDSSTGSDGTITTRKIFMLTSQGTWLTEDGESTTSASETWAYPIGTDITLDVLPQDFCLSITVQWLAGSTVVYTKTILCLFTLYSKTFFYTLTQQQTVQPNLIQDNNYFTNKAILWTYINSAINATAIGNDITTSQLALDAAEEMISNESKYF